MAMQAVDQARRHLDDMEKSPMHNDAKLGVVHAQRERTAQAYVEWAIALDKLSKLARQAASDIRATKKS
jgi:hypothetical protein